ncbi:MAG: LamG-like jellyroll fold domain-containing protein, partial [Gemmatimonadaceae bacterium]
MNGITIVGTGGVPNLHIVEDHAPVTGPESWFELHIMYIIRTLIPSLARLSRVHMQQWTHAALLMVIAAAAACSFSDAPIAPQSGTIRDAADASHAILDGRNGDGTVGFYWLAPIVKSGGPYPGTFDGALAPTVEICEWANRSCGPRLATMTIAGTADGKISIVAGEDAYATVWNVAPPQRDPRKTFRISVVLDGRSIGFADVRGPEIGELPRRDIRFRLERTLRTSKVIDAAGGVIASPDGAVTLTVPAGAVSQPTTITLTRTQDAPTVNFFGGWEFGPAGTTFAVPVVASFVVDPALLAAVGTGAAPVIVTQAKASDTAWTVLFESNYDANAGRIAAPISHFSTYATIAINAHDISCARFIVPPNSGFVARLNCTPPPTGQYTDTATVAQGGGVQTALLGDVSRIYGPLWVIGVIPSCENIILGSTPFCMPVLTSQSANSSIAGRTATGFVYGVSQGQTTILAVAAGFPKGGVLTRVGPPATTSQFFSFAGNASADVGGALGTLLGVGTAGNGKLTLDGSTGFVQLDRRLIGGSGSFSVALFARETVRRNSYVEFISQGFSGDGFYIGHTPAGNIRVADSWQDTGIPMPQDNLEHHYAVTYDEATSLLSLYVDGALVGKRTGPVTRGATGGSNARFGRQFEPFGEFHGGDIDDVGIYTSALSAAVVQAISKRSSDLACSAEGTIRSGSGPATTVVFENQSGEPVKVEWLDFNGNRVLYNASLASGARYVQGTYITHPWIVTGLSSGKC